MSDIKTFDDHQENYPIVDQLYSAQKEGVSKMRASLLASSPENPNSMVGAIQKITVMRIYHQLIRIIKYTEMMDKLEAKMYSAIDHQLDTMGDNLGTASILLKMQSELQKSMIESHKLLQPYMDIKEFSVVDLMPTEEVESNVVSLDTEKRDAIRTKARLLLNELNAG